LDPQDRARLLSKCRVCDEGARGTEGVVADDLEARKEAAGFGAEGVRDADVAATIGAPRESYSLTRWWWFLVIFLGDVDGC
jgi:hypothetical protein